MDRASNGIRFLDHQVEIIWRWMYTLAVTATHGPTERGKPHRGAPCFHPLVLGEPVETRGLMCSDDPPDFVTLCIYILRPEVDAA
jgi:hypothetical protein